MHSLRKFVEETEVCLKLAEELSENKLVQGVHVEPHPDLLIEWLANKNRRLPDENSWEFRRRFSVSDALDYLDPTIDPEFDFLKAPPTNNMQLVDRLPLLVRIHCAPDRVGEASEDLRQQVFEVVSRFDEMVPLVVEDRARSIMAAQPGDQVVGDSPGTLGGTLTNGSDIFGVTCSHVVGSSISVDDASGQPVGTLNASSNLIPLQAGMLCNPRGQNSNSMDAALILLNNSQVPAVTGLKESTAYGSGQRIDMTGAKSGGPNSYRFGSLGLVQKVDRTDPNTGTTHEYCFNSLSSIRSTSVWGGLLPLFGHRARRGDSGAFIVDVTASKWFGMLTAVDGTEGFFLDATDVMNWARSQPGLSGLNLR